MVTLAGGVFQGSANIPLFQEGEIVKNLGLSCTGRKEIKDVADADTQGPDGRSSAKEVWVDRDTMQFAHEKLR